ncbi:anti-sigma factor domain-containing protein, partial [Insulibacter thermoxylanivorax]|uniref:anti-sigma factor domain-containing protein n=1 Tax=Insulibacter thermoxylanivorax TaxID=2749268 RepID=UPI00190FCC4C
MNTGIVMEVSRRSAVVMTRDGRFIKLRYKPGMQVGEEIAFDVQAEVSPVRRMQWALAAAALLLCLVALSTLFGQRMLQGTVAAAVAYLSIDINPSVEIGVDDNARVVELVGLNEAGRELVEGIDAIGRDVELVMEELIERADPYLEPYVAAGKAEIVITSTVIGEHSNLNQEELQEKVRAVIDRAIRQKAAIGTAAAAASADTSEEEEGGLVPSQTSIMEEKPITITTLTVPNEVREDAKKKGISAGKLAVGLIIAEKTGQALPLEEIEQKSITQLAEEAGGLERILEKDQEQLRSNIEQLFKNSAKGKKDIGFEKPASHKGGNETGKNKGSSDDDDKRRGPTRGPGAKGGKKDEDNDDRRGPARGPGVNGGKKDEDKDDRRGPARGPGVNGGKK